MENFENKILDENSFMKSTEINEYLLETSKWGKFLAIVGYVGIGLIILLAIFMMVGFSVAGNAYSDNLGFPMAGIGAIYIVIAAFYYFPVNYLYQYSVQIKQGLNSEDSSLIASGFRNLKSLFKFMGVFTVVILSIYGLILLIAVPTMIFLKK